MIFRAHGFTLSPPVVFAQRAKSPAAAFDAAAALPP